jgi:hypothetical protein
VVLNGGGLLITNDVINGGVVTAGEKVGEKVDHNEALILSLQKSSTVIYSLFIYRVDHKVGQVGANKKLF